MAESHHGTKKKACNDIFFHKIIEKNNASRGIFLYLCRRMKDE